MMWVTVIEHLFSFRLVNWFRLRFTGMVCDVGGFVVLGVGTDPSDEFQREALMEVLTSDAIDTARRHYLRYGRDIRFRCVILKRAAVDDHVRWGTMAWRGTTYRLPVKVDRYMRLSMYEACISHIKRELKRQFSLELLGVLP